MMVLGSWQCLQQSNYSLPHLYLFTLTNTTPPQRCFTVWAHVELLKRDITRRTSVCESGLTFYTQDRQDFVNKATKWQSRSFAITVTWWLVLSSAQRDGSSWIVCCLLDLERFSAAVAPLPWVSFKRLPAAFKSPCWGLLVSTKCCSSVSFRLTSLLDLYRLFDAVNTSVAICSRGARGLRWVAHIKADTKTEKPPVT